MKDRMTQSEKQTALETLSQFDLSEKDAERALALVNERAREAPFNAYSAACRIGAQVERESKQATSESSTPDKTPERRGEPRKDMSKDFAPGQIVVSTATHDRVRFESYTDPDKQFFAGEYLGNALKIPDMPPQFHYSWHEWSADAFRPENDPALAATTAAPAALTAAATAPSHDPGGEDAQRLMRQGKRLIFAAERFTKEVGAGVDIEAFAYMIDVGGLTRGELAHAARAGDDSLERNATFIAWRDEIDETDAARFGVDSRSLPSITAGLDRRMGVAVEAMGPRFDDWIRAETLAIKERYNATRDGEAPDWGRFAHLEATAIGDDPDKWKVAIDGVSQNGRTPIALLHTLADGARVAHDLAATSGLFCAFEKPDLGVILPSHPRLADNDAANGWIDERAIRGNNERLFNCQPDNRPPDWREFDRLEIDGCVDDPEQPGTTIGGLSDSEAEFWTIYGRRPDGEPEPITDCPTLVDAIRTGQDLANMASLDCLHHRLGVLDALEPPMTEDEARQWIEKQEAALKYEGPSF